MYLRPGTSDAAVFHHFGHLHNFFLNQIVSFLRRMQARVSFGEHLSLYHYCLQTICVYGLSENDHKKII